MKKILYISGTRADYGLFREVLFQIKKTPNLKVEIIATGMHLMSEFGKTINEIKEDGFKIHKIDATFQSDSRESMLRFISRLILKLTKKIRHIKPDIIFIQGDRIEMLAGAIVGIYLGIPVIHSHGGEVTSTVDEIARHAITKLSHIHLVSTLKSAERIIKMGEDPSRIFVVGAPGLDVILNKKLISKETVMKKYKLDLSEPFLLVIQHPVTEEVKESAKQMRETMEALKELKYQSVVVYPSADPGGRKMIEVIEKYRNYPFIQIYQNIPHGEYLNLMKLASVIVGNSSSGIIEAPSFHLPAVNIGRRQEGRERTINVIDVDYNKEQIKKAIKKAIFDKKFREKVKKCKNPYGDGKTGKRIVKILNKIKIDKKLLQKKIAY